MLRLGVFGGTFDPPHLGHLLTAVDALEQLSLDRILLVANAVQPLKGPSVASARDRLEMLRLLVRNDQRFEVEAMEVERAGLSFMVETLEELSTRHAGAHLFLIAGADTLSTFHQWRNPERILELATLALITRTGAAGKVSSGAAASGKAQGLPAGAITIPTRTVDISSSEIRERVRKGLPIHGFVSEAIERFIVERALYRQGT